MEKEENYILDEEKIPITIGRINCTIDIKNDLISKTHITINYDKINQIYFLIDNGSTNGTQLLLNEGKTLQLNGEMIFNLGEKNFTIVEKFIFINTWNDFFKKCIIISRIRISNNFINYLF